MTHSEPIDVAAVAAQPVPPARTARRALCRVAAALVASLVAACALPTPAPAPARYDFGPPAAVQAGLDKRPTLALEVRASAAGDGPAMLYRLTYADAQQLRVYRDARWVAPPAELLRQKWSVALGRDYLIVPGGQPASMVLVLEILELSQVFDSAGRSHGLLRVRASLMLPTPGGMQLAAQREGQWEVAAADADAAGGAQALRLASDAAQSDLSQWLQDARPAH